MKKLIIILLAGLLTGNLLAQVNMGVKLGLNSSNFIAYDGEYLGGATVNLEETTMRMGFQTGVFMVIQLGPFFQLKPELVYTQKGSTVKIFGSSNDSYDATLAYDYIEIPVYCGWNLGQSRFYIHTGPSISILINAEHRIDPNPYGWQDIDMKDESNPIDIGLNVALSYKITDHFFVESSIGHGVIRINDSLDEGEPSIINSIFSFSSRYQF